MKDCPYAIIAKDSLINWHGKSEEEASKIISESTLEEIDNGQEINAVNSIVAGLKTLFSQFDNKSLDMYRDLRNITFGKTENLTKEELDKKIAILHNEIAKIENVNGLTLDCLVAIHDQWVVDYAYKFNIIGREQKKYQHAPLQMIGFKEAEADLKFIEPVLNYFGVEVNRKNLHESYDAAVTQFYYSNNMVNDFGEINLPRVAKNLLKGKEFYSALTDENTAKTKAEALLIAEQTTNKTDWVFTKEKEDEETNAL